MIFQSIASALPMCQTNTCKNQSASLIHVDVYKASGDLLTLTTHQFDTVHELKTQVETHLNIPLMCQKMVLDGSILHDAEALSAYCNTHNAMQVMMVVSFDQIYASLEDVDPTNRMKAVESLTQMAKDKDDWHVQAIELICARCEDPIHMVRETAEKALIALVHAGDECVISTLCGRLEQQTECSKRRGLLMALARCLLEEGEPSLVSDDDDRDQPHFPHPVVLGIISKMLQRGDVRGISACMACLEDDSTEVRTLACDAFRHVRVEDQDHAVNEISKCIRRHRGFVRVSAIEALLKVGKCNVNAVGALSSCEKDAYAIPTALKVLSEICDSGKLGASGECYAKHALGRLQSCTNSPNLQMPCESAPAKTAMKFKFHWDILQGRPVKEEQVEEPSFFQNALALAKCVNPFDLQGRCSPSEPVPNGNVPERRFRARF